VREGIAAAKAGQKEEARKLLSKAVELDAYNEQAWIWLSGVVESPEDQRVCLENVLTINPANERARKGLAFLNGQQVDFSPPPPPKPAPPPVSEIPTSVEWDTGSTAAVSNAPAWQPNADITEEEYDSWVTGLNINTPAGGDNAVPSAPSPFAGGSDELFTTGPFSSPSLDPNLPSPSASASSSPPRRSSFEFSKPLPVVSGVPDTPAFGNEFDAGFDSDDPFADVAPAKLSRRQAKQAAKEEERSSKESAQKGDRGAKKASELSRGGDIFMPGSSGRDYTLMNDIDSDRDNRFLEDSEGEGELFGHIPKEIKPTRLPGTRERLPFIGVLIMFVLVLLNIGGVIFLVVQLLPILTA